MEFDQLSNKVIGWHYRGAPADSSFNLASCASKLRFLLRETKKNDTTPYTEFLRGYDP